MAEIKRKEVVFSIGFQEDIKNIFLYGEETFGSTAAKSFVSEIYMTAWNLDYQFSYHPECRYITTKGKIYRNIIIGSYLIIYRIKPERIEVLKAISSRNSISKIKSSRRIKL